MDSKKFGYAGSSRRPASNSMSAYKEFDATELYCPRCKQSVPVRKRLLLVVPEGEKFEYLCAVCSTSVGTKMDRHTKPISLIV